MNLLYGSLIVFLVAATVSTISFATTYSSKSGPDNYRTFTVNAEGKAVGVPDIAQFSYTVFTQGGNEVANIESENTKKVKAIRDFILKSGVDEDDVKTDNYSVEPKYKYSQCKDDGTCPEPVITGYTVTQSTTVKVRDLVKAGDILTGVSGLGVNSVSQLSFVVDDKTALENKARKEAIAKAKSKADATADAGEFRLGKLISISENLMGGTPYYGMAAADMKYADQAVAESVPAATVELNPGTEEVLINVSLTYSIK